MNELVTAVLAEDNPTISFVATCLAPAAITASPLTSSPVTLAVTSDCVKNIF